MKDQIKKIKSELFFIEGVAEVSDIQGYKYDYDNRKAIFGTRVGPKHSVTDGLLHEIAHVAEVNDLSKLEVYSFGLEIKTKVHLLGRVYYEPITWNATKLEARVILWQEVLCELFNLPFDREDFATALQYMPDFMCVPVKGYKFNVEALKYLDSNGNELHGDLKHRDSLRFQSINVYMKEQKATGLYTYSEFRKRWDKAFTFLYENKEETF